MAEATITEVDVICPHCAVTLYGVSDDGGKTVLLSSPIVTIHRSGRCLDR